MADALGKKVDADEWLSLKEKLLEEKPNQWEVDTPNYFGSGKLKDIWNLSAFYSSEMPDEWVEAMTNHWVINSEKGFFGAKMPTFVAKTSAYGGLFQCSTPFFERLSTF